MHGFVKNGIISSFYTNDRRDLYEKSRIMALFVALSMLLALTASAVDLEEISCVELFLENGRLEASSTQMVDLQDVLDDYFDARSDALNQGPAVELMSAALVPENSQLASDADLRAASLKDFWDVQGIDVVSIESSAQIIQAEMLALSGDVNLDVYEWTWVDYNNGDGPNMPATDRMGFATIHEMKAEKNSDGQYRITKDIYDEADIAGYTSADYIAEVSSEMPLEGVIGQQQVQLESLRSVASTSSTLNRNGLPDVFSCIDYADQWVIKDISADAGTHTQYYNTGVYGASSTGDCANYVSQCLFAGGFFMDPASEATQQAGNLDQWWHRQDGSLSSTNSSDSWRYAAYLASYLSSKNYSVQPILSNMNNVYPGNPVWANGLQHVAICVGYNSAGLPIINGHTRDVYHQVITNESSYEKTATLNTMDLMQNDASSAIPVLPFPQTFSNRTLNANEVEWFKLEPTVSGTYMIYTTGNSDTVGYLYQETKQSSNVSAGPMHLYELAKNDKGPYSQDLLNFRITAELEAGETYYIRVRLSSYYSFGTYSITFQRG